ncbi:tripartite tricarboxylate transporter substrate binding protein [Verminephrobacter aporrectodeae subsp. tuberculatae]|uniref:Bug family tripartite tricarboxylate transporter substrate binding protein n=1 Tax=Verminephrobacter aporrectodeae TaxID=1110389 RepID=UPI0022435DFF|nr:tripartite tricarboxylate transporter substrate binding protein [Verminephrobacter aporrectodeae]MCW8163661.1 tripartite tricarboxylate transporter substrate binding protein [Verminephrobacter aporrectodeae subsp. tuberculatae]MCW8168469.1 tripartite tricarboxylate transporter substrate binding protein [Verminephrobacter aporrectodeae subsp. tuberculatae]MCW8206921.1 tripartite tricarboxylate transporter substrate binding protein [Verminephrobacter aporrectodeae subsp. tuberculatae]
MPHPSSSRRHLLQAAALTTLAPLRTLVCAADPWPAQPIKLVVPFPAGGNTDLIARILVKTMADDLGQAIVIDNRSGAGGNIGVESVAKAAPDGYTLAYSTLSTYALNVGLYHKLAYGPVQDLAPVALTVQVPLVLVVPAGSGIRTLTELLKQLKSQPGKFSYGSAGNGTSGHIACHRFVRMADVDVQHVPYKGSAPAMTDLMAGNVHFSIDAPSVVAPLIRAGRLNAIAVAVSGRIQALPQVPTFDEAGLPGLRAYTWNAVWAPAGTPQAILDRLNAAVNKALSTPANTRQIEAAGVVPYPAMNRSQVQEFMKKEYDAWVPLVRSMRMSLG